MQFVNFHAISGGPTQSIRGVRIQRPPTADQSKLIYKIIPCLQVVVGPRMRLIKKYIIPKIAAKWKDVADFLDYEIETIELIEQKYQGDGEQCCDGLIRDWLSTSHGVGPKTWATLLAALKEIEKMATATSDIERELKKMGIL